MARITSILSFRPMEGKADEARQEIASIMETARNLGGDPHLSWISAGSAPPGGLVLHLVWPDAETYAKAISDEAGNQFRIAHALGETALDVITSGLSHEVIDPGS